MTKFRSHHSPLGLARTARPIGTAIILLGLLGGCASFSGSAKPVTPLDTRLEAVNRVPEATALVNFAAPDDSARGGVDRKSYRNYVAGLYLQAVDARYAEFRTQLSQEAKGARFGSGTAILLMNGAAIVSGAEGARALAASAAVASGTYATYSKEVLYEKTLQALLAAMDAQRAQARGQLAAGLLLPADQYSMGDAFSALQRIEEQASLDVAAQHVTSLATADARKQEAAVQTLFRVGVLPPNVEDRLAALVGFVETLAASSVQADKNMLGDMADALKVPRGPTHAATAINIKTFLQSSAVTSDLDATFAKLKPVTNRDSY